MNSSTQLALDPRQRNEELLHKLLVRDAGPWKLDAVQKEFLRLISLRQGRAKAMQISDIVGVMRLRNHKVDARAIKQLAAELVVKFEVPIGASRRDPYGYYLIETIEELRDTSQIYENEIKHLSMRHRALNGHATTAAFFGQLELTLAEEIVRDL